LTSSLEIAADAVSLVMQKLAQRNDFVVLYMNCWAWEELLILQSKLHASVSVEELQKRFDR